MAFIRIQALKKNDDGVIIHGSASIVASRYDRNAKGGHCRQEVIESLGRVLYLSADRKEGIFLSPIRGMVKYNVQTDEFSDVDPSKLENVDKASILPPPQPHTHFGDVYLLIGFLNDCGLLKVFRSVFPQKPSYERFLVHLVFDLLREGSHEKCDTFFRQSAISQACTSIVPYTLHSDTTFFEMMGAPETKKAMFIALTQWMRNQEPAFGSACYVDSSPLPNDSKNNPYNALRCQPATGCAIEQRLALVLDQESGMPVWYEIFPGNRTDVDTLKTIIASVLSNVKIDVTDLVLDSGYVSANLLQTFNTSYKDKSMIARMPDRKGYPYKELYRAAKPFINDGEYAIERNGHLYFGKKYAECIQGQPIFAYVLVDKNNADTGATKYLQKHEKEFRKMTVEEKDWRLVASGYFVLLSNIDSTVDDILYRYIDRASVEAVFKDSKTFLRLLPLEKWSATTVEGKILSDIVAEIVRSQLLKSLPKYRGALSDLFAETQIIDCFGTQGKSMLIDDGNKQAKGIFRLFGKTIPGHIDKDDWIQLTSGL